MPRHTENYDFVDTEGSGLQEMLCERNWTTIGETNVFVGSLIAVQHQPIM